MGVCMSFKDNLNNFVSSVKIAAERTSNAISDAIEHEDTQAAIAWSKNAASTVADEATRLGKEIVRSDMAKDAATGAAIGAAVAMPLPVIGPAAGAVVGAGLGIYKNITKPASKGPELLSQAQKQHSSSSEKPDAYDQLIKFDELRQKGILTDAEFEEQKKKILGS